jgi:hypothetical protein
MDRPTSGSNSQIQVIDKRHVFCFELIGECLTSHPDLNEEDINFALQVDCTSLSDEKLAILTVHLCKKTDTGRFSLSYNYDVDMTIIRRDKERWPLLLDVTHQQAFPEYYQQIEIFTPKEREAIEKTHCREYNAAFRMIKKINELNPPYSQYLIEPCPYYKEDNSEIKPSPFHNGIIQTNKIQETTIYQNCLNGVCIAEREGEINFTSHTPNDMIIIPSGASQNFTRVQCFELITLVRIISIDPAINPSTGQPFDPRILAMIRNRLAKEIKLYKYFLAKLAQNN